MGVILTIALVVLVVAVALWFLRRAWWRGRPSRSSHSAGSGTEGPWPCRSMAIRTPRRA